MTSEQASRYHTTAGFVPAELHAKVLRDLAATNAENARLRAELAALKGTCGECVAEAAYCPHATLRRRGHRVTDEKVRPSHKAPACNAIKRKDGRE